MDQPTPTEFAAMMANAVIAAMDARDAKRAPSPAAPAFNETDRAALAAAKAAGITRPADISSDTQTATAESVALDNAVLTAKVEELEALVNYLYSTNHRLIDRAAVLKEYRAHKAGSDVIDPHARRGN